MKKPNLTEIKNKAKNHVPEIVATLSVGIAIATTVHYRRKWPKDLVCVQLPDGVLEMMKETGKGLAVHDPKVGWLTIKHHPVNPKK